MVCHYMEAINHGMHLADNQKRDDTHYMSFADNHRMSLADNHGMPLADNHGRH